MEPIHFTINKGWMGDPNGLVYHPTLGGLGSAERDGTYHLFYQLEPKLEVFTEYMHWGHATSKDLVKWDRLPIALNPDELGPIWSGSSVIDKDNTSGFGKDSMICLFTHAGGETYESSDEKFTISLAYSNDGINFTKYHNNPIIRNITRGNRDPKVILYNDRWLLIFTLNDNRSLILFTSTNLIDWEKLSIISIEGINDCPDLVHLDSNKFLIFGTDGRYVTVEYNDEFIVTSKIRQFAHGETESSQCWNNSPNRDITMIFRLGDMENSHQTSQMSIPISIKYLEETGLIVSPHSNIINHFVENGQIYNFDTPSLPSKIIDFTEIPLISCQFYMILKIRNITGVSAIDLIDGTIKYDRNKFSYNSYGFPLDCDTVNIQVISDYNSIEIFVNENKYIGCYQHGNAFNSLKLTNIYVESMRIYSL